MLNIKKLWLIKIYNFLLLLKISFAKIAFIVYLPISLKLSFEICLMKDEINIYFLSESSLESVVTASGVVSSETGNIKLVGLRTKKNIFTKFY
jgi:hypothetical protein